MESDNIKTLFERKPFFCHNNDLAFLVQFYEKEGCPSIDDWDGEINLKLFSFLKHDSKEKKAEKRKVFLYQWKEIKKIKSEVVRQRRLLSRHEYFIAARENFDQDYPLIFCHKILKNKIYQKYLNLSKKLTVLNEQQIILMYSDNPEKTLKEYRIIRQEISTLDNKITKLKYYIPEIFLFSDKYSTEYRIKYLEKLSSNPIVKKKNELFRQLEKLINNENSFYFKYRILRPESNSAFINNYILNCYINEYDIANFRYNLINEGFRTYVDSIDDIEGASIAGMYFILNKIKELEESGIVRINFKRLLEFITNNSEDFDFYYQLQFIRQNFDENTVSVKSIERYIETAKTNRNKIIHKKNIQIYKNIFSNLRDNQYKLEISDFCNQFNISQDEIDEIINQFNNYFKKKGYSLNKVSIPDISGLGIDTIVLITS